MLHVNIFYTFATILFFWYNHCVIGFERAKDNGDIYVINVKQLREHSLVTTKATTVDGINFDEVMTVCNSSFIIPMDYLTTFNTTGELPNVTDKTGMCFLRCYYEQSGLINNWELNADLIRQYMWPATGDSIEFCQMQGKDEMNACVRTYSIVKCLMIRAIVDARNKPTV